MPLFHAIILILTLSLSPFTSASELIGGINYGESRDIVTSKLIKCKGLKTTLPPTMLARLGLNGSFITKNELAGLKFSLFFDWTDSSGLKEINYRSDAMAGHTYDGQLKEKWDYAYNVISAIYGRAKNAGDYPKKNEISTGKIQFSHEWQSSTGYIYLGVGQLESNYSLNITFSQLKLSSETK